MRAERHGVVTFNGFCHSENPFHDGSGLPTTLPSVGLFVAVLPVPRQVERFVNSRPLRQLHRWYSGIIGHGRTDWMKSDNCRFHPAMTRNTPWKWGVEKGGAAGSGIGNRGPPVSGANSCNEKLIRPTS